jgi:hypothetical protein
VELNPIIAMVLPGGELARGAVRGTWPESESALFLYDAVVLGDVPPGLLSQSEWRMLEQYVVERGGTLCLLAPGPARAGPAEPRQNDAEATGGEGGTATLRLTDAGAAHPVTRALAGVLRGGPDAGGPGTNAVQVLLRERRASG